MGSRWYDLTGQSFDCLVVTSKNGVNKYFCSLWNCLCKCGGVRMVRGTDLKNGKVTDCGCVGKAKLLQRNYKHGHSKREGFSPTYESWRGMLERCTNLNNTYYHIYGGSGVTICEDWYDFKLFLKDMGERPKGKTIDRIDTLGNYEKSNCKWSTRSEQALNRKWQWNDKRATKH